MPIKTTGEYGPRHYYDTANPDVHYPSVTSITSVLPKDLSGWHANMAAERAIASISYLPQMEANSHKQAVRYIADAGRDHTKAAINKGNAGHEMFERMILGESPDVPAIAEKHETPVETLQAIYANFSAFLDRVQPEIHSAEYVSWSDEHGYAGSYDVAWSFKVNERGVFDPQGEKRLDTTDYKTGKNVYPSVAVQLAAYSQAEYFIDPDDASATKRPAPTFTGLSVLHVNENVCSLVDIPREVWGHAWRTFLACRDFQAASIKWAGHGWGRNRIPGAEDKALGHSVYTKSGRRLTGTERRS